MSAKRCPEVTASARFIFVCLSPRRRLTPAILPPGRFSEFARFCRQPSVMPASPPRLFLPPRVHARDDAAAMRARYRRQENADSARQRAARCAASTGGDPPPPVAPACRASAADRPSFALAARRRCCEQPAPPRPLIFAPDRRRRQRQLAGRAPRFAAVTPSAAYRASQRDGGASQAYACAAVVVGGV